MTSGEKSSAKYGTIGIFLASSYRGQLYDPAYLSALMSGMSKVTEWKVKVLFQTAKPKKFQLGRSLQRLELIQHCKLSFGLD